MKHLDRYRGCLLGGAAGDALGYPVEFLSLTDIQEQYGPAGITSYTLQNGVAQISDDTQMTLFTANGLLFSETRQRIGAPGGGSVAGAVAALLSGLAENPAGALLPGSAGSHHLDHERPGAVSAPGSGQYLPGCDCPGSQGDDGTAHQPEQRLWGHHAGGAGWTLADEAGQLPDGWPPSWPRSPMDTS